MPPILRRQQQEAGDCQAGGPARGLAGERRRGRRLRATEVSGTYHGGGGGAAPPVVCRAAAPPLPRAGRAGGAVLQAPRPRLAGPGGVEPRWTVLLLRARPAGHPSLRHPESRASGSEPAMRNVPVPGLTPGPPTWEPLTFRDHRRGDPGWTSPGLSPLEVTPSIQTSEGGPIPTSALQRVARNVPRARGLECSRSSTVGEGLLRDKKPGGLPAGSGQALASGCHSG